LIFLILFRKTTPSKRKRQHVPKIAVKAMSTLGKCGISSAVVLGIALEVTIEGDDAAIVTISETVDVTV